MPALVFLVLVGLFAHSVFVPAGPVSKPEVPLPKVVVINTAGQVIDTWQQNTKGEIIVEVLDIVEEDIAEAEPVEVPAETPEEVRDEGSGEEESADDSDSTGDENAEETEQTEEGDNSEEGGGQDEESVDEEGTDPVEEEEEVIEETFEAPPIVEDPVLVIEDETAPETEVQNLVEALIGE